MFTRIKQICARLRKKGQKSKQFQVSQYHIKISMEPPTKIQFSSSN